MCGIIGVLLNSAANQTIYDGLTILQHRGQDAAGIMTDNNGQLCLRKDNGLVRDVFKTKHMERLKGNLGIGHIRYPTAGTSSSEEAQPFFVNSPYGIALAHNGNLTNADFLREQLTKHYHRHLNTNSDSEILLNLFAHELQKIAKAKLATQDIFNAIKSINSYCYGGYAVVVMIMGYGLVAFRDPNGIRPLAIGSRKTASGVTEYIIASESVAIDALDFKLIADVAPGEAVCISLDGEFIRQNCAENPKIKPCIFEYVYLSRPDSILDGISVYRARMAMGEKLADNIAKNWSDNDIEVVMPIPDTSRTAAQALALRLNLPLREGFIKNRYIGRTFIMPGQAERQKSVKQKLNAIDLEFKDKKVLLVDDSIVRGTTSREIIQMARESGAKKVYFASAAPPVRYPNVYGIDMPSAKELIAAKLEIDEIAKALGADKLIYQTLADLKSAILKHSDKNKEIDFEVSIFNGEYCTGDISCEYLAQLQKKRSDAIELGF